MTAFTDANPGQTFTLTGSVEEGFDTLHGVPTTTLGENADHLMALGHLTDRAVLAVTNAYHRRVWGQRILPCSQLADLTRLGTKRIGIKVTKESDDYAWHFDYADRDDPTAQAATIIDIEWLCHEDIAVQSECPTCNRSSRSTNHTTGPGRTGWGHYHHCRYCDHKWPTAPARLPNLTKHRRRELPRPDGCFACFCVPEYSCTARCTIQYNPLIGQRLCATCRNQLPDDVWRQLAAVAYGTATTFDDLDDQRDRWLYSEALRGIPPTQATQTWQHRLTLTALRADLPPQSTSV
ncbi:hypothetical protein [Streptomyces sp. NPDC093097]|uniref:hypothetical protein n=1 Tax=Streptomyces sp. NPDC093097 TaxID=3366027 RepID=UPI003804171F